MPVFAQDLVTTLLQYAEQKEEFKGACAQIKLLPKGNALMNDMVRVFKEEISAIYDTVPPRSGSKDRLTRKAVATDERSVNDAAVERRNKWEHG